MAKKKASRKKTTKKKAAAKKAGVSWSGKKLVEFNRNIAGPPRRATGQRAWLTHGQALRQGITDDDITIVKR